MRYAFLVFFFLLICQAALGLTIPVLAGTDSVTITFHQPDITPPLPPGGRLQSGDLTFLGAFRVPRNAVGSPSQNFSYALARTAFNPLGNGGQGSLLIEGAVGALMPGYVAEVDIPTPVVSSTHNVMDLPTARFLTPFTEITSGNAQQSGLSNMQVYGFIPFKLTNTWRLYWTLDQWGNSGSNQFGTHGYGDITLSANMHPQGNWNVQQLTIPGIQNHMGQYESGNMTEIPADFAAAYLTPTMRLGAGASIRQNLSQSSWGPSLVAFEVPDTNPPPPLTELRARTLVFYPNARPYDPEQVHKFPGWSEAGEVNGSAFLRSTSGKRAVVFTAKRGLGDTGYCYGVNTGAINHPDPPLNTHDPVTNKNCYDPCSVGAKGYHAYPYSAQMFFYDESDVATVARGEKKPWEILPYEVWNMPDVQDFTNTGTLNSVGAPPNNMGACQQLPGGIALDAEHHRLYLVVEDADRQTPGIEFPLVYVYGY